MEPYHPSEKLASVRKYREQNVSRSMLDICSGSDTTDPTVTQLIGSSSECNPLGVKSVRHKFAFRLRMSLSELFLPSAICFMFLLLQASVFSSSFANATSSWGVSGRYNKEIITVILKIAIRMYLSIGLTELHTYSQI